ncbi:MAG: hypothetical protein ACFB22_12035 [Rhodothalassiaceae bacterium]
MRAIVVAFLLSGCAVLSADGLPADRGEPLGPSVTIDASSSDRVTVAYEIAEPVRALEFRRVPDGQRAERWAMADPAFRLVHDADTLTDRIVRVDGAPFTTVRMTVPAVYANFPKDYAAFMPYRQGGLLIHSGRFQVCADACAPEGEPDPADAFPMTVRFPDAERAIVEGRIVRGGEARWTDRNDGTMVYVGKADPVETEHVVGVIDPNLPPTFRAQLDELFPALMAYYAERLHELTEKPMLFVALDRDAVADGDPSSSSFSSQGGTLPNQVFMHLAGDGWLEDPATWPADVSGFLPWFFAHEAGHLYQHSALGEPSLADTWIHEGGADAFAAIALSDLGVEESYVAERLPADARRCEEGLKEGPLRTAGERGDFDLFYNCGMAIQLLADREVRSRSDGCETLFDVWETFLARVADGAAWDSKTFLDVLASHSATEALAMAEWMIGPDA